MQFFVELSTKNGLIDMQTETDLENILTTHNKNEMVAFINSYPEFFDELIQLALVDKQPYSWRAAWLLYLCMKKNDNRIQKYIPQIVNAIAAKKDGHQRELIKILLQMELKEEDEGVLFNLCMDTWEQTNKKPSVRFTAFKFIVETVKKYPELREEISSLTQEHYLKTLSPGIKISLNKIITEISK